MSFFLSLFFLCRNVDGVSMHRESEKKPAPMGHLQNIPATEQTLASHLPPTAEAVGAGPVPEPQHEREGINPESNVRYSLQFVVSFLTI